MTTSTPSTKSNYIYLYLSQAYIIAVGIVIVPFHLKYLGIAAYGLIGIYTTIQIVFQMLDVGMTPTLSREASRFHVGAITNVKARSYLRVLEFLFFIITLSIFIVAYFSSAYIANAWFPSSSLEPVTIQDALYYLTLVAGVRWYSGLYRAFIAGFENQVWLSKLNIVITTLRFVGVLPILIYYESSIVVFFQYQLIVAAAELYLLIGKKSTYLKINLLYFPSRSDISKLKSTFKLSITAGSAGLIWVLASQSDKMLLVKFLTLEQFGYFSMAVLLVNGVMVITAPITKVALPKLTKLAGLGLNKDFYALYLNTSKNIIKIAFSISIFICFYSYEIVYIWTADKQVANEIYILVYLYALGNGFLAVSSLTYYFQIAKGDVKLHVIGVFLYLVFINFSLFILVPLYNLNGAGYAWLLTNVLYFFFWCPLVIFKFNKNIVVDLFFKDFLKVVIPIFFIFLFSNLIWKVFNVDSYLHTAMYLIFSFFIGVFFIFLVSSETRNILLLTLNGLIIRLKRL